MAQRLASSLYHWMPTVDIIHNNLKPLFADFCFLFSNKETTSQKEHTDSDKEKRPAESAQSKATDANDKFKENESAKENGQTNEQ